MNTLLGWFLLIAAGLMLVIGLLPAIYFGARAIWNFFTNSISSSLSEQDVTSYTSKWAMLKNKFGWICYALLALLSLGIAALGMQLMNYAASLIGWPPIFPNT